MVKIIPVRSSGVSPQSAWMVRDLFMWCCDVALNIALWVLGSILVVLWLVCGGRIRDGALYDPQPVTKLPAVA